MIKGDNMKPVIGVMPLWDEKRNSLWMLPSYLDAIQKVGGIPIILPFNTSKEDMLQVIDICDGFLFTGGDDVNPTLYHEEPLKDIVFTCEKRDEIEFFYFAEALKRNKSILGICRGLQMINVALGGSLYQDIPLQVSSNVNHRQERPYDSPVHPVDIEIESPLYKCLGTHSISVNSCHHQAIKDLASSLKAMAVAPDGIVEAFYHPESHFLWAVQWHPEMLYKKDSTSLGIFKAFIDSIKK